MDLNKEKELLLLTENITKKNNMRKTEEFLLFTLYVYMRKIIRRITYLFVTKY
jgi:hypothetical protein